MTLFVNAAAADGGDGSAERPFAKISQAAARTKPGDRVRVAPGVYREWVRPETPGREDARIVFESQVPLGAVITGAEPVKNWEKTEDAPGVWRARVPNSLFGEYNPYTTLVEGDWYTAAKVNHTGEVFLNGRAMTETLTLAGVLRPEKSAAAWHPEFTDYTWYTEQDAARDETVIYANFHGYDPNREDVEITARRSCFRPEKTGVGYITLSGFRVCKAACQWAPPTAFQDGMIGPNWSKGWIIEDCEVSDAKCSGISLGKYYQPGDDNKWLHEKHKDGTQTQRDCVIRALREGWSKETVGSHTVRRCHIHDCGQTGIVGHMGCAFSRIENCRIHHINDRQNLAGAEIGGIKLHAAIDTVIAGCVFSQCTRGIWLDWQAQGARVTGCLFFENALPQDHLLTEQGLSGIGEDLFIEISHGPTLVDHNLFLSDRALKLPTQGVAVCHNLIAGAINAAGRGVNNNSIRYPSPRYTPYHVPHSTALAGFMTVLHGDMRFYNNIFTSRPLREGWKKLTLDPAEEEWNDLNLIPGTFPLDFCPTEEEWEAQFAGYCGMGSPKSDRYYAPLPLWTGGNVYLGEAQPSEKERNWAACMRQPALSLREENGRFILSTDLYDDLPQAKTAPVTTASLGQAFEPEQPFENPDGTPLDFSRDLLGMPRGDEPVPGPFETGTEAGAGRKEFALPCGIPGGGAASAAGPDAGGIPNDSHKE